MPSTSRYGFEVKLFDWAGALSAQLCGSATGFFLGLRPGGSVRRIYFTRAEACFAENHLHALMQGHFHWLLYQPCGVELGPYIEWCDLERCVAERWIGSPLVDEDFADRRGGGRLHSWPNAWRVIF